MPRDTYYQHPGNPVQTDRLPSEGLRLQFAHRAADPAAEASFAGIVLRNLFLVAGICLAGDWLADAFQIPFPFNLLIVFLLVHGMINLWRAATIYRPNVWLLIVPFAIHLLGIPFVSHAALTTTLAAFVGREFTRHYIAIATSFPYDRTVADAERDEWDTLTIFCSLLVVPFGLVLVLPATAAFWMMVLVGGVVMLLCLTDPTQIAANLATAWHSWCTYNRHGESAPGVLSSPAGPLSFRLGMTVLLVSDLTLLLASRSQMSQLVWGNAPVTLGAAHVVLWTILTFLLVGLPVVLAIALPALVALPAIWRFSQPVAPQRQTADWNTVISSIRNSSNPVERDSIFLGRVSHDGSPLLVPRAVFREHAHILGDSGSGKTARGLIPLAEQLIADRESSLMVIDLKGDSQEILSSLNLCAKQYGTGSSPIPVRQFSIREDHATFAFNPFQLPCWQRLNLFQRSDVLCGALGLTYGTDYGRGFYSSANASVLHATLRAFPQVGSFSELSDRIAFVTSRSKAHGLSEGQSESGNHVRMIADRLGSFKPLNVTPEQTPSPEVTRQAMDPAQLFARQEIFYFHLSTTLGPGYSPEIARLAMFMLLTTATLTEQRRQVYLMVDEFQRVAAQNVDAILQIARSMNVGVILANQSMLDLKGDDLIHVVEANCRYRQWYAISSPEEQERLSKASGQTVDLLHSESTSRQRDGWEVRTTTSRGSNEFIAPRLSINDVKLASDDPRKSIALVTRGAGYSQFGGMPVVVESDFHITEAEFLARKNAPWPSAASGSFVPCDWTTPNQAPPKGRKKRGPLVTEETIGDEPDLFGKFLADNTN